MKKYYLIISFLVVSLITSAQINLRWYPVISNTRSIEAVNRDSTIWLSPSINGEIFSIDVKTGEYAIGIVPGVGYGIKWNPFKWKENYLLGLDLFGQASLNSAENPDYFNIEIAPVVTFLNWFKIGYGPKFGIGLNGVENKRTWVFMFGISKSL